MDEWIASVAGAIEGGGWIPTGAGVVVGVSGGCDSMVLLRTLAVLAPGRGWRLVVAHVHHGLRGAEADDDAERVRAGAADLGLPFRLGRVSVEEQASRGESMEMAARRLRHGYLAEVARGEGCERIALGHHADDQVELFLLRLLRGAGGRGLGGMRAVDRSPSDRGLWVVRPFLGFTREAIRAAAGELGVGWGEDGSNRGTDIWRNRIRHELIPLLRERFQPALGRVLGRGQEVLRAQAEWVERGAREWLGDPATCRFEDLAVAVQRDAVRLQLEGLGVAPGFELIEALRTVSDTPIQVDAGRRVRREAGGRVVAGDAGVLEEGFRMESCGIELGSEAGAIRFGGVEVAWQVDRVAGTEGVPGRVGGGEYLDADAVGDGARLRYWRPGDRFQPIGLGAAAKLQDLFTNARVAPGERRDRVLLEAAGGGIVWVEGLRLGEAGKVTLRTRRRLRWAWRRVGGRGVSGKW
ncbi:MAG: tRNA lysidine(34) synthetase TilS [Verrucomicrobiae bacterium]|nr:tRNA lysidine(34) synthetase TilS [Verrucomicrobiae bacterium]